MLIKFIQQSRKRAIRLFSFPFERRDFVCQMYRERTLRLERFGPAEICRQRRVRPPAACAVRVTACLCCLVA